MRKKRAELAQKSDKKQLYGVLSVINRAFTPIARGIWWESQLLDLSKL